MEDKTQKEKIIEDGKSELSEEINGKPIANVKEPMILQDYEKGIL